jgi:hypothetical protein
MKLQHFPFKQDNVKGVLSEMSDKMKSMAESK